MTTAEIRRSGAKTVAKGFAFWLNPAMIRTAATCTSTLGLFAAPVRPSAAFSPTANRHAHHFVLTKS